MGSFEGRIIRSVCEFDSFQFESRLGDVLTPNDIIIRKTRREQDSAENLQFFNLIHDREKNKTAKRLSSEEMGFPI